LLLGYWPPTDKGSMLTPFATRQQYRRLNGQLTNYDVLALSAVFTQQGTFGSGSWPFYGGGTGLFRVDYKATSTDFWQEVPDLDPIAILSFSWMPPGITPDNPDGFEWKLERDGRNLAQTDWERDVAWSGGTYTIDAPYIGGSADDPSPERNNGTITGDPPDRTVSADTARNGLVSLASSIKTAVEANTGLTAGIGSAGTAGGYVSEFMAYHVAWYRDRNPLSCLFAGHTHVAQGTSAATGETAVRSQLDILVDSLP
jgi:hypothetical protein